MSPTIEALLEKLRSTFGHVIENVAAFRDEVTVQITKDAIAEVVRFLHDNPDAPFTILEDLSGVDQLDPAFRFEVVYHLFCLEKRERIGLKVRVPETDCTVPTITGIFEGANWPEREAFDMYGIEFSGHPDLRRVYMPEEFEHFPLRKDFPLMGIPGSLPLPTR